MNVFPLWISLCAVSMCGSWPAALLTCMLFNAVSDGLEVRPKYKGILHCLATIWKVDGLRGLYQGVTPNVWGAGLSWGLYFFL